MAGETKMTQITDYARKKILKGKLKFRSLKVEKTGPEWWQVESVKGILDCDIEVKVLEIAGNGAKLEVRFVKTGKKNRKPILVELPVWVGEDCKMTITRDGGFPMEIELK